MKLFEDSENRMKINELERTIERVDRGISIWVSIILICSVYGFVHVIKKLDTLTERVNQLEAKQ